MFWLATRINPQIAEQQPDRVVEDLLRAVQGLDPAPTVVLLSSGGTVSDPQGRAPYDEQAPTRPLSAYGAAKLALESLLAERAPGRHVTLRVANAYGPGQPVGSGQGIIAHWPRAARRGEPVRLFGDPATTRDYVNVEDISEALVAVAASTGPLPPVLNVGSGRPTTLQELAETVLDVVAAPPLSSSWSPPGRSTSRAPGSTSGSPATSWAGPPGRRCATGSRCPGTPSGASATPSRDRRLLTVG